MSMNSMSAGMRMPQNFCSKPNWLMNTTLMLRRLRVEFLHALVIRGFAVRQIRQTFAMDDRPVVVLLHPADVVRPRARALRCKA